ncbi:MAG: class II aldolase/adducin family protein [Acidobacteriaceae bacterium]
MQTALVAERREECLGADLAKIGRWLHALGFAPATAGNLSLRLDQERILATPTGCSKRLLKGRDMVTVDLMGRQLSGTRGVTSEIGMHLAVYQMRDDVNAIVHAHPPVATAFASSGLALDEPLCAEILMTLGKVPLAPYATTGTTAVAESLAPLIPDHDAILLANHGVVTYGRDLMEAYLRMEAVEHFAQVALAVRQIGSPQPLGRQEIMALHTAKVKYLRQGTALAAALD